MQELPSRPAQALGAALHPAEVLAAIAAAEKLVPPRTCSFRVPNKAGDDLSAHDVVDASPDHGDLLG